MKIPYRTISIKKQEMLRNLFLSMTSISSTHQLMDTLSLLQAARKVLESGTKTENIFCDQSPKLIARALADVDRAIATLDELDDAWCKELSEKFPNGDDAEEIGWFPNGDDAEEIGWEEVGRDWSPEGDDEDE